MSQRSLFNHSLGNILFEAIRYTIGFLTTSLIIAIIAPLTALLIETGPKGKV